MNDRDEEIARLNRLIAERDAGIEHHKAQHSRRQGKQLSF